MRRELIGFMIAIAVLAAPVWDGPHAHEGATGIVATRMESMEGLGADLKTLAAMVHGKTAFDNASAAAEALSISTHANSMLGHFPEGTNAPPSRAAAEIWTEWDDFTGMIEEFRTRAGALIYIAAHAIEPSDLAGGFDALKKGCQSCHSQFRLPE